jgi:hypothetical protein
MNDDIVETNDYQAPERGGPSGSIWGALILIGLGLIFLFRQMGVVVLENWWALFILIPAVGAFGSAIRMAQVAGRLHYGVWSTFYGGLFPLLVAVMFLFDLDWAVYWPLFVVLGGFGMLTGGLAGRSGEGEAMNQHRPWAVMVGLSATLLGLVFLLSGLGRFDPNTLVPAGYNWWGLFILLAAVGGLLSALLLLARGRLGVMVVGNLLAAAVIGLTGAIALLGLDWELMRLVVPLALILGGAALLLGFFIGGGGASDELSPGEGLSPSERDRAAEDR